MDILDGFLSQSTKEKEVEVYKEQKISPFDVHNDLTYDKKRLFARYIQDYGVEPSIPWFIVDKIFGMHFETVLLANEMNRLNPPNEARYYFYENVIPKKRQKRVTWYKTDSEREKVITTLMEYFQWGRKEAEENLSVFYQVYTSEEQNEILEYKEKEGVKKNGNSRSRSSKNR